MGHSTGGATLVGAFTDADGSRADAFAGYYAGRQPNLADPSVQPAPVASFSTATANSPNLVAVRLPASETLQRLLRNRGIRLAPPDPSAFVDLSALPAWELRRPRSWDALDATVERLLAAVV
jgi:hypothetical protein